MEFSKALNTIFELDRELDQKQSSFLSKEYIDLWEKINDTFRTIYASDKFISSEISYKYFHEQLIALMHEFHNSKKIFYEKDVDEFLKRIREMELIEFKVLRSIIGAKLHNPKEIYKLGDFEIYHYQTHKDYLHNLSRMDPEMFWHGKISDYLIGFNVHTREKESAAEIAYNYFYKFEMCYYFIKAMKDEHHEIGILNYSQINPTQQYILSSKMGSSHSGSSASFRLIEIDDEYFIDEKNGYDKMWRLISKSHLTKYEEKIISSIIWAGKSMNEKDIIDSFIQIAISLEILLTYSEKGQIITPSITHQISEAAAIIIGDTFEDRIKVEKDIKELYGIRSSIVHSGEKDIDIHDYYKFFFYVKDIIIKLITFDKYKNINTVSELHSLIKKIKYS